MMARFLVAVLFLIGSTSAAAQSARVSIAKFGECTIRHDPNASRQFVETPIDDRSNFKLMNRIVTADCFNDGFELEIPPPILRASIFEALYKRDFLRSDRDLRSVAKLDYMAGYKRPLSRAASHAIAIALVGDCVVRADPTAARELISTVPETSSEDRAMNAIAARLPACVDKGQTVPFSRSTIRGAVAEALYRLNAQAMPAGVPK